MLTNILEKTFYTLVFLALFMLSVFLLGVFTYAIRMCAGLWWACVIHGACP